MSLAIFLQLLPSVEGPKKFGRVLFLPFVEEIVLFEYPLIGIFELPFPSNVGVTRF